jgi:hypothetical protein
MERIFNNGLTNFECSNCHHINSKIIAPNSRYTGCSRCGTLVDIEEMSRNSRYNRQRTSINNINYNNMHLFPDNNNIRNNSRYNRSNSINFRNNNNNNFTINNTGMFRLSINNDNYDRYSAYRRNLQNPMMLRVIYDDLNDEINELEEEEIENLINRNLVLNVIKEIQPKPKPKLKKEKMNKKLWIKNEKGVLEAPTCCICLNVMKDKCDVTKLKCNHIFHFKCLEKWVENKEVCPFCRGKIEFKSVKKNVKKK